MVDHTYTIEFPEGYFDRREEETPSKGWLEVFVNFGGVLRYRLSFYDPVRLQQTLHDQYEQGLVHFTEPGLVLLSQVTTANVERAVEDLLHEGFFTRLCPETIVDNPLREDSQSGARQWQLVN